MRFGVPAVQHLVLLPLIRYFRSRDSRFGVLRLVPSATESEYVMSAAARVLDITSHVSKYELRCRECHKSWGNQPKSICDDCFSPLEIFYDYDALRGKFTHERIASRAPDMWRYAELLPLPPNYQATLPVGFTPLLRAPKLAARLGAKHLFIKNDAVCLPTLSFKDRVVAVALAQARSFGFDTVACSSTGNLANSVAAQAARNGFKAWIFVPADLEPAKILGTQIYGAKLVRIAGSYDQVNRLCSQIADEHRWGFVNVNLRPYYAEGSKTVGFEIAEQLGWRLPDNVVVPMAGGIVNHQDQKGVRRIDSAGSGRSESGEILRRAGDWMLSDFDCCKGRKCRYRTSEAGHAGSLVGYWQSGRRALCHQGHHKKRRLGGGCF